MKENMPCPKNWNEMESRGINKFCTSCSKEVLDLSTTNWDDIYNIQKASNFNTCGRYTAKQFKDYPIEISKRNKNFKPILAAVSILLSLSNLSAQSNYQNEISGKIIDHQKEPIPFASIHIENTKFITMSDIDGHFTLKTDTNYTFNSSDSLVVQSLQYQIKKINIEAANDSVKIDLPKNKLSKKIKVELKEEYKYFTVGLIIEKPDTESEK